jgi:hypothetical protein
VTGHSETLLGAAAKLSPPATVIAASAAGWSLQDWVWGATLIYTVLLSSKLVWDWLIKPNLPAKRK